MKYDVVSPIFGFDSIKEVAYEVVDDFFSTLTSEGIAFTLIDPTKLRVYDVKIPLFHKDALQIEEGDDVRVYCTVIVHSDVTKSSINFAAPIVINHTKKSLTQVALENPDYGMAENISAYI